MMKDMRNNYIVTSDAIERVPFVLPPPYKRDENTVVHNEIHSNGVIPWSCKLYEGIKTDLIRMVSTMVSSLPASFNLIKDTREIYISANCEQYVWQRMNEAGYSVADFITSSWKGMGILALPDTHEFKYRGRNVAVLRFAKEGFEAIHYWYGI